jgi:ATP/maltotriose-dependent transcriptional regulator MalT
MAAPTDRFVGRERELGALHEAFGQAVEAQGSIVMLAGEPGIGKTRTAQELARHAETQGAAVLWGRCPEEAGAPPYWPWVQIIRGALRFSDAQALLGDIGVGASDIADIVPEIRDIVPHLEPSVRLGDAAQARFRMFESIRQLLTSLSRRQPTLLVLDDLHWADAPSLRLLEFLAPEIGDCRLIVLGTYRPTELSRQHPLSDALGAMARAPNLLRVGLGGLSAEEVHDFVAATALQAPAWLTGSLYTQTEGNPLFLREIVRFLEQQGVLRPGGSVPLMALPPAIRIPEGVKEVIGRRLNLLSAACNETLALAAVIGRDFAHDVLLRAGGGQQVIDALDEALAAHIIEETGDAQYQFSHNLIRATLYDELRPAWRRQLHRSVGNALEAGSRRAELDAALPELARHFLAGGDIDKALDYATRAGQRADALLAFEDAVQHFQTALDAVEHQADPDETKRCQLLLDLGEAERKANAYEHALATLHRAFELARRQGKPGLCARAALAYERAEWRNGVHADPPARRLLELALRQLPTADAALRAQLVSALARTLVHQGAAEEAHRQGELAIEMARRLGDPRVLATCMYFLGDIFSGQASDESLQFTDDAIAAAEQAGSLEMVYHAHGWRFVCCMQRAEIGLAQVEVETLAGLQARIRQVTYAVGVLLHRFMLALMRGELTEAESLIVQLLALLRSGTIPAHEDQVSVLIFSLRREQGRLAELRSLISAFLRGRSAASIWLPGLAVLYIEVGQPEAARAVFEQAAASGFATLPRDGRWLLCMVYLSEACAALGAAVRAAELYELLLPHAGGVAVCGLLVCAGSADRYLGLLCTSMQRWAEAERHFEAALTMNRRMGAHLPLAHTRYDYAAMLLARDERGNRQRAAGLLRDSLSAARRLGMRALEERAAAALAELLPETPPPAAPDDLTSREIDVLRLIAIGRSNADIAMVLEISLNTVATHVRNILAKTGCANRTEAAAYAMRHNICRQ